MIAWKLRRNGAPEEVPRIQQELFAWYEQGKLKPHVMTTYPLAAYHEALAAVRDRKALGKVVIEMR